MRSARVYDDIVGLLGQYDMVATFAFVLAFTMNATERERFAHLFEVDDSRPGGWLLYFRVAQRGGNLAGWLSPRRWKPSANALSTKSLATAFAIGCWRMMRSPSRTHAQNWMRRRRSHASKALHFGRSSIRGTRWATSKRSRKRATLVTAMKSPSPKRN